MARMFPEWITNEQRKKYPKRRGEIKVYDALHEQLQDDRWWVFYGRSWDWVEDRTKRIRTRENDFVVAHDAFGILLLEVKGGGIQVKDGEWWSVDRDRQSNKIKNPYDQVASATSRLEDCLHEHFVKYKGKPNLFKHYRFSNGVCFPDVDFSGAPIEPKHHVQTIDVNALPRMEEAIVDLMKNAGRLRDWHWMCIV